MNLLAAYYATLSQAASVSTIPWTTAMSQPSAVTLPDFARHIGRGTYTFEFWMNSNGSNGTAYTTTRSGYNRFGAHIPFGGTIYYDSGAIDANGRLTYGPPGSFFNSWHHVVFQADFEHQLRRIVLDGVVVASVAGPPNYYPQDGDDVQDDLTLLFQQGPMGEVRYWNTFRSVADINALKDVSLDSPAPGLLGCWRLDERGPSGTVVRDRSGNNYHGFLS